MSGDCWSEGIRGGSDVYVPAGQGGEQEPINRVLGHPYLASGVVVCAVGAVAAGLICGGIERRQAEYEARQSAVIVDNVSEGNSTGGISTSQPVVFGEGGQDAEN